MKTLIELYEYVDELIEELGEDAKIAFYNPITHALEEVELTEVSEFDQELDEENPCVVIHSADLDLEELGDEPEGGEVH